MKCYARVTDFVIIHKNNHKKYPLLFQDYFIAYPCSTVLALCVVKGASFETGVGFSFDDALALSKAATSCSVSHCSIAFDSSISSLLSSRVMVKDALWSWYSSKPFVLR